MSSYFEPGPFTAAQAAAIKAALTPTASFQYGTVAMSVAQTSNTATITSVDLTRSHVVFLGVSSDDANPFRPFTDLARLTLTNATTVTVTRFTNASTLTVAFVVITWSIGAIKNIQSGNIVIAGAATSNTATITAVVTAKTLLQWTGQETGENTNGGSACATLALTNTTTITATRVGANATTVTVGWVAVEFN